MGYPSGCLRIPKHARGTRQPNSCGPCCSLRSGWLAMNSSTSSTSNASSTRCTWSTHANCELPTNRTGTEDVFRMQQSVSAGPVEATARCLPFLVGIPSHQIKHSLRRIGAEADVEIAGGFQRRRLRSEEMTLLHRMRELFPCRLGEQEWLLHSVKPEFCLSTEVSPVKDPFHAREAAFSKFNEQPA